MLNATAIEQTVNPQEEPISGDQYTINEIFCSLQGEGLRAGTLNHFIRLSGCNLTCKVETHGFDFDT